jgi:beta-hydroxylase
VTVRPRARDPAVPRSWDRAIGRPLVRALDRLFVATSRVGDEPLLDPARFPWTTALEARWRGVRAEAERVCAFAAQLPRFHELSPDQARISGADGWRTFFLMGFGLRAERALALCPETAALLDLVPGIQTAFFSVLAPGKRIPLHHGITKALLRCHLGLVVPEPGPRCAMRVGDAVVTWREGRCLVFDDTCPHEVWNDGDAARAVLLLDFRRPLAWPGHLLAGALFAGMRRSGYVRDARARHAAWESGFDQWLRAQAAAPDPAAAATPSAARSARDSRASSERGIPG